MGIRTRPGAADYDSGITTLPAVLTTLTVHVVLADRILLCNLTAVAQAVTLTDRNGNQYLNEYPLQKNMTITVDLGHVRINGLRWQAGAADAVNAQLLGDRTT